METHEATRGSREPVLAPDAVSHLSAANVSRAAADLELSLEFCSIETGVTREDLIRTAAYLHAEARSFAPGGEAEDWFGAERQVDHWLSIYGLPHHFTSQRSVLTSV